VKSILKARVAEKTFNLSTLKQTQLPKLYIIKPTMLAEANTMITQQPPNTPALLNETSLLGFSLKAFNGNRDNTKEFMCFYKRWWRLNNKKAAFSIPYK